MPRRPRCVLPGVACHITQRGVDRRETFSSDEDRNTYLRLLSQNLVDAEVSLLAWCLMTNHVHLVAVPAREDSLSILLRRVHGRYAQYYNARTGRSGHLWQNRFFACVLGPSHLWTALAYVEQNPVRSGIVSQAADYRWSSAAAHLSGMDDSGLLDMEWWQRDAPKQWGRILSAVEQGPASALRGCTHSGRPFGDDDFMGEMEKRFNRHWNSGPPKKEHSRTGGDPEITDQLGLFSS